MADDYTPEDLENAYIKYRGYTFDPFASRDECLRDTFAIPSQTFAAGALLEWVGKQQRRLIESKAAYSGRNWTLIPRESGH